MMKLKMYNSASTDVVEKKNFMLNKIFHTGNNWCGNQIMIK